MRIQGSTDVPLNDHGVQQIQDWIPRLRKKSFAAIFSSPLLRAKQSAEILSDAMALPIQIEKDLREGQYGPLEGLTIEEFKQIYAKELKELRSMERKDRNRFQFHEDYESAYQILKRALPCLRKIANDHFGANVLVVTHGWVMKSLFAELKNLDEFGIYIHNSALIHIQCDGRKESIQFYEGIEGTS